MSSASKWKNEHCSGDHEAKPCHIRLRSMGNTTDSARLRSLPIRSATFSTTSVSRSRCETWLAATNSG
ncbi:MAG: hypothetical protein IT376_10920 [Polyangiaceae bacterium]|nr:hypothetical protein [Polyangiaceae bacterium]